MRLVRWSPLAVAALLAACTGARARPDGKGPAAPAVAPQATQKAPDAAAKATSAIPDAAQKATSAAQVAAPEATSVATAAVQTPDAPFRANAPPPEPTRAPFVAPVPVERRLKSGARLLVVENRSVPLVSIEVLLGAGVDAEPPGKAGLAGFTAALLREATRRRPAGKLAEEIEDLALRFSTAAGPESSVLRLGCLKETLPEALDLLADVLLGPAFAPADVERVRGLLLTAAQQRRARPAALAADEAARLAFGDQHPWGQPEGGTAESLRAITADDLARFHATWYRPDNAVISVAGDVGAAEIERALGRLLARWEPQPAARPQPPPPPALAARTLSLIDKPGASQSQVWAVGRSPAAADPERLPLQLANLILGGLFESRLNLNLREAKGYSYGVRSSLTRRRGPGLWLVSGAVKADVTAESVVEVERELAALAEGGLRDGELERAREALLGELPLLLETGEAVAGAMAELALLGLPLDYYRTLPDRIAQVDAAAVAQALRSWLLPGQMPLVVVGPAAASEAKLRALGLGAVLLRGAEARPAPVP
jgi:zinc protease